MFKRLLSRLFTRKTALGFLFFLAALAALLAAIHLEENWRGRRAWAAYKTGALARGAKLTLNDFLLPPVPDSENFAAIPLIQEIFSAQAEGKQPPNPFNLPVSDSLRRPSLADPLKGDQLDLAAWRNFFLKAKFLEAPGPDAARDVLLALNRYEPALAEFRTAAARPSSRFPVPWEKGFATPLPHLGIFQSAVQVVSLRMSAHLAVGESAAAYADFQDALASYRVLKNEPVLISGLVRISMLARLENALWGGLAERQWAEPELRKIQADLGALNVLEDYQFCVASERGSMNDALTTLLAKGTGELQETLSLVSGMGERGVNPFETFGFLLLYPKGCFLQNQVLINELFDEQLARVDSSRGVINAASDERALQQRLGGDHMATKFYYMLANLTMPAIDGVAANFLFAHTLTEQTRIACALERFRLANDGLFPERLEALVPAYIPALPLDVMNGAPLHYRRTPAGSFELWSVGANLKDDDAVIAPKKSQRQQPDWVWRYPAAK